MYRFFTGLFLTTFPYPFRGTSTFEREKKSLWVQSSSISNNLSGADSSASRLKKHAMDAMDCLVPFSLYMPSQSDHSIYLLGLPAQDNEVLSMGIKRYTIAV